MAATLHFFYFQISILFSRRRRLWGPDTLRGRRPDFFVFFLFGPRSSAGHRRVRPTPLLPCGIFHPLRRSTANTRGYIDYAATPSRREGHPESPHQTSETTRSHQIIERKCGAGFPLA